MHESCVLVMRTRMRGATAFWLPPAALSLPRDLSAISAPLRHAFRTFADDGCGASPDTSGGSQQKGKKTMGRTFLLASALKPQTAARAAAEAAYPPDVVVRSPSALAREAAAIAVGGRWVVTIDEPLLA